MSNAFNWKGQPSIFTTGVKQHNFGEAQIRKHLATSLREKRAPTSLAGGSPYEAPDLILNRNPRRNRIK
jgi:hypothetical protein